MPPDLEGRIISVVSDGEYTIEETLVTLQKKDGSELPITMTPVSYTHLDVYKRQA